MRPKRSIAAQFVVDGVSSNLVSQNECSVSQHLAGNAELHPAPRAPGMDMRAGESFVMYIPWGVAP